MWVYLRTRAFLHNAVAAGLDFFAGENNYSGTGNEEDRAGMMMMLVGECGAEMVG